jgi:hypothetical protein
MAERPLLGRLLTGRLYFPTNQFERPQLGRYQNVRFVLDRWLDPSINP